MSVELVAFGPKACFTSQTNNVERLSYDCITPSAARGILEALLWRPEFRYEISEIHVLKPLRWFSMKVNEVKETASYNKKIFIDVVQGGMEGRTQRNMTGLRDVAYRIKARIHLTEKGKAEKDSSGGPNSVAKYESIFNRRLESGQFYHAPYLGFRELAADIRPVFETDVPAPINLNIRGMLYDVFDIETRKFSPTYVSAKIKNGIFIVPSWEQIKGENHVR